MKFIYIGLICFILALQSALGAQSVSTSPRFTSAFLPVAVTWQILRSRSQDEFIGTLTETYAVEWRVKPHGETVEVVSPFKTLSVPFMTTDDNGFRSMQVVLTRGEFAQILGVGGELPQDGRLWESMEPLVVTIKQTPSASKLTEVLFRHSDDNGTIIIRLSARLASSP